MSHIIDGYVAKLKDWWDNKILIKYPSAQLIPLDAGLLGFVPLTCELAYGLDAQHFMQGVGFPIAYIRTDYFGGGGEQEAHVVHGKQILLEQGTIDQALLLLGVERTEDKDQFDIVGFGKYRDNESWVERGVAELNWRVKLQILEDNGRLEGKKVEGDLQETVENEWDQFFNEPLDEERVKVDRYAVNDALCALAAQVGVILDDDTLNELTHHVADVLDA